MWGLQWSLYLVVYTDGTLLSVVTRAFTLVLLLQQKMAVPPTYVDLGKPARDVFTKGYGECCREGLSAPRLDRHVWGLPVAGWAALRTFTSGEREKLSMARKAVVVVHSVGVGSQGAAGQWAFLFFLPGGQRLRGYRHSGVGVLHVAHPRALVHTAMHLVLRPHWPRRWGQVGRVPVLAATEPWRLSSARRQAAASRALCALCALCARGI